MQNADDMNGFARDGVNNQVGHGCKYQFARVFGSSRPPHRRKAQPLCRGFVNLIDDARRVERKLFNEIIRNALHILGGGFGPAQLHQA